MSTLSKIGIGAWAIGHSALYGYHLASLNGVQDAVICPQAPTSHWALQSCLDVPATQFGVAVTVLTLGGLLGSLSADGIVRSYGRPLTLRLAQIGYTLGAAMVGLANSIWLMGAAAGLVMVAVPPLLASLSHKHRTVLGIMHQISIGVGMLIAQSLSLVLSRPYWWRVELAIGVVLGAVLLVSGAIVSEPEPDEDEGGEREALLPPQKHEPISAKEAMASEVRYGALIPAYVVIAALCAQQACGISPVMYFSSRILDSTFGGQSKHVSLIMMAIGTPFNFLPGLLKARSKTILILSAGGTALCSLLLGIGLNTHNTVLSGTAVILFVISFSVGLAPVAWVVLSEVVPPEARTAVGSIAVSVNWLTNFTTGSTFLPLQEALGPEGNVFYVYAVVSCVSCVAIWTTFRIYERHQ